MEAMISNWQDSLIIRWTHICPNLSGPAIGLPYANNWKNPVKRKKIVDRGVTDVVTPGVTTDDTILDRKVQ
jgi:hypothetical protein